MQLLLFTDGGARGNPGPSGIGVFLTDKEGAPLIEHRAYLGEQTNNWAEYEALIRGLSLFLEHPQSASCAQLSIHLDSELIVRQLEGAYRVKHAALKEQYAKVQELLARLPCPYAIHHVPREKNAEADRLVNEAIDEALAG